jgi:hypothetical protein
VVGEHGYPEVPLLYGIPPGVYGYEARRYGDPRIWSSYRYPLHLIVRLRASTVYAASRHRVDRPFELYEREVSLAAVSEKPVDTEAQLARRPLPRLSFDAILEPTGPTAPTRRLRVVDNPKLPRSLEKLVWDDATAREAVVELYRSTGDVYLAANAMALGLLGRIRSRRLVPTRWAITAVDSIVGDYLASIVRHYRPVDRILVAHSEYLGNRFTILVAPGAYEIEMVEVWHPYTPWTRTAREPVVHVVAEKPTRRITEMDGGFMAARLAVLEQLARMRRSARVLVVREITREYYAPVGNWHIRETVRRALAGARSFDSLEEALSYVAALHPGLSGALRASDLARRLRSERRLDEYFTR